MTFMIEKNTIKFFAKDDYDVWTEVADVAWEKKWNGKIKLTVQYVSRYCDMCDLLTAMDGAIAAIKTLSRTVG